VLPGWRCSQGADAVCFPLQATGTSFKKVNWLKAGILACDKLLTVSPNYATGEAAGWLWGGHTLAAPLPSLLRCPPGSLQPRLRGRRRPPAVPG
jgi:hypothetical protein